MARCMDLFTNNTDSREFVTSFLLFCCLESVCICPIGANMTEITATTKGRAANQYNLGAII